LKDRVAIHPVTEECGRIKFGHLNFEMTLGTHVEILGSAIVFRELSKFVFMKPKDFHRIASAGCCVNRVAVDDVSDSHT
jgi:hypothetical protein